MNGLTVALREALFGDGEDGDEGEGNGHALWAKHLSAEIFRRDVGAPPDVQLRTAYQRLHRLNELIPDPMAFVRDPLQLARMHEWIAFVDPTMATAATIHYNLFLGSLADQGAFGPGELAPYTQMRQVGTYLVTEVAHGNDAAAMETTATYDRATDTFVLHTPGPGAQKFMPNTSPVGGPKTGVVAARLVVDGTDEGVFLFLVPLTDADRTLPGIRVRRLPARMGSPLDHSLTSFDAVRVPRGSLLPGTHSRFTDDGRFVSDLPRSRRHLTALQRVMTGKLCMSASAVGGTRVLLTLAVRYGHVRRISGLTGSDPLAVFALRSHHGPLAEAVATTWAMTLLYREAARRWKRYAEGHAGDGDEAARVVSAAKAWITWQARDVALEARERCGAQGLLIHNGMAEQLAMAEAPITAEGDNQATMVKVAAELLVAHRATRPVVAPAPHTDALTRPEVLHGLLEAAQSIWLDRAGTAMRRAGGAALARRNSSMGPALRAADVYAHRHAAQALAAAAAAATSEAARELLAALHVLFALRAVAEHSGDLLRHGFLTDRHLDELPVLRETLITRVADNALTLVDAFAVPEEFLRDLPIAAGDEADFLAAYDDPEGPWHSPERVGRP